MTGISNSQRHASVTARDSIAGSALAFAALKNVPLAAARGAMLADAVAQCFTPLTLEAFVTTTNPMEHPAILAAIDARRDEFAPIIVIMTFARAGGTVPPPAGVIVGFVADVVASLPPPAPGPLGYRWPDVEAWEQMAAARLGVAAPADRAAFGAMIVAQMGQC